MSRYTMCPVCGHRMSRVKDSWGTWDGETYTCTCCSGYSYMDYSDEGCMACGNPAYPYCKDSCPLYDD